MTSTALKGGASSTRRWEGVLFRTIQERVKPRKSVEFAWFECADGYTTSLPLIDFQGDDVVLAHRLNGEDLSHSP